MAENTGSRNNEKVGTIYDNCAISSTAMKVHIN